jgi:hypothetical protein
MKRITAASAMAMFAVIALATAPQAAANPDDDFLKALTDGGITFPASMNSQVVTGGRELCKGWSSGASASDEIGIVTKATGLDKGRARVVVRAATNAYCPTYLSKI